MKIDSPTFLTETTFISASVQFSSGSQKFGDTSDDLHQFTGSQSTTGTGSFGRLILPSGVLADKSAPHLAFGDGDTGFFENGDDGLSIAIAGNRRWFFGADTIFGNDSGGPAMMAKTATATQPVYSFEGDLNTGIGKASADNLSLITAGKESLRVSSTLVSGSSTSTGSFGRLLLAAPSSAATVPDLAFSDGNSGFKLRNPAQINVVVGGAAVAQFNGDRLDLGSF